MLPMNSSLSDFLRVLFIFIQNICYVQELEKLPEYSRQQLIKVLSRTRLLGADEELLELVNSVSSGFLQEPSTSPHASRRSRSPEKRSAIRISKDRNSPSPVEKPYRTGGLPNKQQRTRSANRKSSKCHKYNAHIECLKSFKLTP